MIRGRACCKSDGSTNLSGRLHHGNGGHGHWVSHVARRRVGEAPRHGGRCESRCATREPSESRERRRGPALIDRESTETSIRGKKSDGADWGVSAAGIWLLCGG
uniref:Uncharacterized protein n=1 Tax=Aegilops tauschii subsp. strangulata TaxID=200361 RepID=A0A453IIP6_AEGTS